jgi:hypothetical protein
VLTVAHPVTAVQFPPTGGHAAYCVIGTVYYRRLEVTRLRVFPDGIII